ncbi:MAG: adenylate kinase [Chloroflexi bacterium RBG_19FT_COMBO_55_16]|nr:MAG: adenylate kinase [Chloroflexi bacterium RBG_19FT_COMBO_55_16]
MSNFVVLLGPPGAGKGTQAQIVSDKLGLPHISSGDIFRENFKNKTELGKLADGYIKRGELVPDEITIAMIQERLSRPDCEPGALLDGFPRTPAQAEALEGFLVSLGGRIVAVLYIKVPDNLLIDRLAGRWTCRAKGHIFHEKNNPPKNPGRCDIDGSELYQRDDDKAETVARRIRVYFEQTQELIDHYKQRGLLVEVDGSLPIEEVTAGLLAALAVVR